MKVSILFPPAFVIISTEPDDVMMIEIDEKYPNKTIPVPLPFEACDKCGAVFCKPPEKTKKEEG